MSDEQWIWQCERAIPSDTEIGRQVIEEVLSQMRSADWVEHDRYGVRLAVEEALVNAIVHGNGRDPAKQVHVCCHLSPDLVRIEIHDEGEGFDPIAVPNPTDPDRLECPSGRGVMLMRAFMSCVEFNESGNCVMMEKVRQEQ